MCDRPVQDAGLEILVVDYEVANWHKSAELFEEQWSTSFDEMSQSG